MLAHASAEQQRDGVRFVAVVVLESAAGCGCDSWASGDAGEWLVGQLPGWVQRERANAVGAGSIVQDAVCGDEDIPCCEEFLKDGSVRDAFMARVEIDELDRTAPQPLGERAPQGRVPAYTGIDHDFRRTWLRRGWRSWAHLPPFLPQRRWFAATN